MNFAFILTFRLFSLLLRKLLKNLIIMTSFKVPNRQCFLSEIIYYYDNWSNPFDQNHIHKHQKNSACQNKRAGSKLFLIFSP